MAYLNYYCNLSRPWPNVFSCFQFWQIPSFHLLRFAEQWKNLKANPRQLLELHNQQQS